MMKQQQPPADRSIRAAAALALRPVSECPRPPATAAESLQVKLDLLASLSYDIRTLMTSVLGLSHLALKTELTDQQRDYLTKIESTGGSLLSLLNSGLRRSEVEARNRRLAHPRHAGEEPSWRATMNDAGHWELSLLPRRHSDA